MDLSVLLWTLLGLSSCVHSEDSAELWSNATTPHQPRSHRRRQLPTEINIQVTAPLFSSRLYDFGPDHGDTEIPIGVDSIKRVQLQHPIIYFGESHDNVYITSNGAIGFDDNAKDFRIQKFPIGPKLIAPFWNRNDLRKGGKVFYREVTEGKVLERSESEIRYQYDKKAKPMALLLITFFQMQPVSNQTFSAANTNTFQIAIISTDNGTFANCIYKNIGWSQGVQAGFNKGDGRTFYLLPPTHTVNGDPRYLEQVGNTGIPGEWMFEIDMQRIARCKPGIKGDTCENECSAHEWGYDCSNCCHCQKGSCNVETGDCQTGSECTQCWGPAPSCQTRDASCKAHSDGCGPNAISFTDYDRCGEPVMRCQCLAGYKGDGHTCEDIDECANNSRVCGPNTKCTNTPGRYYCECLPGYQSDSGNCTVQFLFPYGSESVLPRIQNSKITWTLQQPLRVYGHDVTKLIVISNGLVLFEDPGSLESTRDLEGQSLHGFAPYFGRIDLTKGGIVAVNESTDADLLTKASKTIQQHSKGSGFVARSMVIITYVNVSLSGDQADQRSNTFQTALVTGQSSQGEPNTYAFYLYKDLGWTNGAQAMILADDPGSSVVLPGSGTDGIRQLSSLSNIQEPGKWLFRVDQSRVQACPDGSSNPPYCVEPGSRTSNTVAVATVSPVGSGRPRPVVGIDSDSETVTFPSFITVIPAIITPGRGGNSQPGRPSVSRVPGPISVIPVTIRPTLSELFNISSRGEPGDNVGFSVGTPPQPAIVLVTPPPRQGGNTGGSRLPQFIFSNPTGPTFIPSINAVPTNSANSNQTPIDSVVLPTRPEVPFSRPDILIRPDTPGPPGATGNQPLPTAFTNGSTDLVLGVGGGSDLFPPLQVFTTSPRAPQPARTTRPPTSNRPEGPRLLTGSTSRASKPPFAVDNKIEESEPQELSSPSKLAIIIPTVIVGVWLLLLLVVGVVVCCRRRSNKKRLRSKYDPYNNFRSPGGSGAGNIRGSTREPPGPAPTGGFPPTHTSYEDHLEKAARLSEMPNFNQNGNRVSLYNSYWNVPSGRSSQYPNGAAAANANAAPNSSYFNQGYYESCPEFSRFGFSGRY